ncbi:MAG: hypothetical protein KDC49_07935 [Saprospiraceae bacterium]|nr:hypothetical protein [Saprospiraceae bacterium]
MFNSIFKRPKARGFNYQPRYYDQAKEELQNRLAKYKKSEEGSEPDLDVELTKERIRSGFANRNRTTYYSTKMEDRKSSFRLIIIMACLFLLAYMMLRSDKILTFVESMSGG